VLSLILKSAVQARLLAINPCDGVRLPPKRRRDEPVTLSREEVTGKLLPEIPDRYRALVATSAYTGLRWGECVGLYREVIDLDSRRLRVVRVLVEVSRQIKVKPFPKSRAGQRTVPVPRGQLRGDRSCRRRTRGLRGLLRSGGRRHRRACPEQAGQMRRRPAARPYVERSALPDSGSGRR
jgi:integrase